MKKLLIGLSTLVMLLMGGCATTSAQINPTSKSNYNIQSASQFVVIDQSEPAFIVFTGIPKDIDQQKLKEIKSKVSTRKEWHMLTWEQFLKSVDKYARSVIIRSDYPDIDVVSGIVCLVGSKKGSGAPWGLTWNSGVALTFMDYQHTRRIYKLYKTNPDSYKPIRDSRRDPINPRWHLSFAGCY